ncbi:MAG: DUF5606 domain-containing protein [Bacteroidales bacterium]|nr:DUF5606 domain-containing protein [Bacteroidales bacterium]
MLKAILSIAGQGGLFKLVSQGKNTIIVEDIATGKRLPAYATSRVSALEDISMYTTEGDVTLKEVMANIYKYTKGEQAIDPKKASSDELKKYMDNVLPTWDKDRIYVSDLKKLFGWYNILQSAGLVSDKIEEEEK